jgi:thymidylate synthase
MSARTVEGENISDGWLGACATLLASPGHETTHLVMRMSSPLPEDPTVRENVDTLLRAAKAQDIVEVRNTIFPAGIAEDYPEPAELADAYMEDYAVLRQLGSPTGTYFGRICRYPTADGGSTAQLTKTVAKLREYKGGKHWRARYQINIYASEKDAKTYRGFPCMAHLCFQLAGPHPPERLDCLALYRNQDMIRKGYGNLLGLAELQRYIAAATGLQSGELTVIAGHADMKLNKRTRALLEALLDR